MIKFNARLVGAVALGALNDEVTAPWLMGVNFEGRVGGGAYAVAINRHILVGAYDPDGVVDVPELAPIGPLVINKKVLAACRRAKKDSAFTWDQNIGTGQLSHMGDCIASSKFEMIDWGFPDWKGIVSATKFKSCEATHISAENMRTILAISRLTGKGEVSIYSGANAYLVRFSNKNIFVVLSLRYEAPDSDTPVPDWLSTED